MFQDRGKMFSPYIIISVSVVILNTFSYASKYNVSFADLATCREYNIEPRDYSYLDFFHVNSLKNLKSNDDKILHLKFYVMTTMDAHILLAEGNRLKKDDRVYEIVLGAGKNVFSAIRSKLSRERVAYTMSPGLLSYFDPTPVEIIQHKDGTLVVNIPNYYEPHLKYTDLKPLNISHMSFSSYGMVSAKWFYDCAFDGFAEEMQMETKPLTNEERLIADLLSVSDAQFPPPNIAEIPFSFKVRSVEFDQQKSILNTRLHMILNWTDSRLAWDPKEYGEVKSLTQPMFKIWHPELNIAEGAMDTFEKFEPFYSIRLEHTGYVHMYARNAELHSWCFAASENWPKDTTRCNLTLAAKDSGIKLSYDIKSPLAAQSINELSEWIIDKVEVSFISEANKTTDDNDDDGSVMYLHLIEGELVLRLTISRNSEFYQCAFLAPALVSEGLILLAFFLEEHRRGGLNLVAFIVLCIGYMVIALHAPKGLIPNIVVFYDTLLRICTLTYLVHIGAIWFELYPPKMKPHRFVMSVVNCSALRFILVMRQQDSTDYLAALEYPWREVSKIINRILFIAILITFCVFFSFV